jgi:hypothetical protein
VYISIPILIVFGFLIFINIKNKEISLKFSYLWVIFIVLSLVPIVFSDLTDRFVKMSGFQNTSDGLIALAIIYLALLLFYATITISRQQRKIEELSIQIAIRVARHEK